jgi:hypothetical protein
MQRALKWDEESLLHLSSGVNFDRRLLMTVGPEQHERGVIHRGLAVLNFDLVGALTKTLPPIWEGVWTGLRILQILKTRVGEVERAFIFAVADNNEIGVWELTVSSHFDEGEQPIRWILETRSSEFQTPFVLKNLQGGQLWADRFDGTVQFTSLWNNDQHPCWAPWMEWTECGRVDYCPTVWPPEECITLQNTKQQFRNKMSLSKPPEYSDPIHGGFRHTGFEFQVRMEILGYCRIKKCRITAERAADRPYGKLPEANGRIGQLDYSSQVTA